MVLRQRRERVTRVPNALRRAGREQRLPQQLRRLAHGDKMPRRRTVPLDLYERVLKLPRLRLKRRDVRALGCGNACFEPRDRGR